MLGAAFPYKTLLSTPSPWERFLLHRESSENIDQIQIEKDCEKHKISTKVDRVRKPMHRCIEDQTLKEGIFLVFGQT